MINLGPDYLLFIEPDKEGLPAETPIMDEWSSAANELLKVTRVDIMYSANPHITNCGRSAYNAKIVLPNGVIVHSLMPYYFQSYRKYIPLSELVKFRQLAEKYLKLPVGHLKLSTDSTIPVTQTVPEVKQVVQKPVESNQEFEIPKLKVNTKPKEDISLEESQEEINARLKSVETITVEKQSESFIPEPKIIIKRGPKPKIVNNLEEAKEALKKQVTKKKVVKPKVKPKKIVKKTTSKGE